MESGTIAKKVMQVTLDIFIGVSALSLLVGIAYYIGGLISKEPQFGARLNQGLSFILIIIVGLIIMWLVGTGIRKGIEYLKQKELEQKNQDLKELVKHVSVGDIYSILLTILSNDKMLPPLHGIHPTLNRLVEFRLANRNKK